MPGPLHSSCSGRCCCRVRVARGPRPRRQWQSRAGPAQPWRWVSAPAAAPGPASCGTPGRRLGGERGNCYWEKGGGTTPAPGLSPTTKQNHKPAGLISARARVWSLQARAVLGGSWGAGGSQRWAARISPVISEMSGMASAAGTAGGSSMCAQAPAGKW